MMTIWEQIIAEEQKLDERILTAGIVQLKCDVNTETGKSTLLAFRRGVLWAMQTARLLDADMLSALQERDARLALTADPDGTLLRSIMLGDKE